MTRIPNTVRCLGRPAGPPAAVLATPAALLLAGALAAALLAPSSARATAAASSPFSTLSGSVQSANGTPVAGDVVTLYPADPSSDAVLNWDPAPLGQVTTDAQGRWTFTVPSDGSLPAATQTEAAVNNGWLNVAAIAFGMAKVGTASYEEEADAAGTAWAAPGAPPAMEYAFPAVAMTMAPEQAFITSPAAVKAALAAPYSPYMVDGVNLAGVSVTPGVAGREPKQCRDDHSDWRVELVTKKKTHAFTNVGEYHTNWKATGGYTYTTGADTSVSFEVSADGVHFHAHRTTTYSNSAEDTDSVNWGPFNSHLVVISLKYREMARIDYPCKYPGITTCYPKITCAGHYWVEQTGLYNPGGGWKYIKLGKSVHSDDGYSGWLKDGNTSYLNAYDAGFGHCVSTGHGISYARGAEVSLGLVSVSMETETNHRVAAEQCIQFSSGKRYNELELNSQNQPEYNGDHMAWGSNALLTAVPGPRVFYNY